MGAALARAFELPGFYEVVLVILTVVTMFYFMLTGFRCMRLEPKFWRNLFAGDKGYLTILQVGFIAFTFEYIYLTIYFTQIIIILCPSQIRDLLNLYTLYSSIRLLYQVICEASEMQGIGLKQENLGEGIGFVVWNGLVERGYPIPEFIAGFYPWAPQVQKSSFWSWSVGSSSMSDQNMKNIQMINGAKLVLAIAGITASIMKLSYFAVLHTYVRTMRIFTDMQDASPPQSPGGDYFSDFKIAHVKCKIN